MEPKKQPDDYLEKNYSLSIKSYKLNLISYRLNLFRFILAVLAFVVGIVGLYLSYRSLSGQTTRIEKEVLATRFSIVDPVDGAIVPMEYTIRGKTPFADQNCFIIVTPLKTGDNFVQGRANVSTTGLWSGKARFGSADVGSGEEFMVRALATRNTIPLGTPLVVPDDAIFSESIIVKRQ
jgi:hypothetical protein